MAYDYIPKGQKLHPKCVSCQKQIVLDVDQAKKKDKLVIICPHCNTNNEVDTKELLSDLDKKIRVMFK